MGTTASKDAVRSTTCTPADVGEGSAASLCAGAGSGPSPTPERVDKDLALDMREGGTPITDIAELLGVSRQRIAQVIAAHPHRLTGFPRYCAGCARRLYDDAPMQQRYCSKPCRTRASADEHRGECVDCGEQTTSERTTRCWNCDMTRRDEQRLGRWAVIKALWDGGFLMDEIVTFPEVHRANRNALSVELDRMKKAGIDLPYRRPGWRGGYRKGGPAPRPATSDKQLIRMRVGAAVRAGKLEKPDACERCGAKTWLDGHHHDYSRPFDVEWLCRACHMAHHAEERRAVPA